MIATLRSIPRVTWLGLVFIAAHALDYATYAQAPGLERNLVPILIAGSVFYGEVICTALIIAGASILVMRGRQDAPVLLWAQAVLLVGTIVAVASFLLNAASITIWRA